MLQAAKETRGDIFVVRLSGSIEENVDFNSIIGTPPTPKLDLILKEVQRINSVGVKAWIKYFQSVASKGVQLRFLECSTAIVEQINLISNFTCGGTIESIFVPFSCEKCGTELLGLFQTKELKKNNLKLPISKCSKCGGNTIFDDIPEEYFGFLLRSKP